MDADTHGRRSQLSRTVVNGTGGWRVCAAPRPSCGSDPKDPRILVEAHQAIVVAVRPAHHGADHRVANTFRPGEQKRGSQLLRVDVAISVRVDPIKDLRRAGDRGRWMDGLELCGTKGGYMPGRHATRHEQQRRGAPVAN